MGAHELGRPAVAAVVDVEAEQRAIVGVAGDAGDGDGVVGLAVSEGTRIAPQHPGVDRRDHAMPAPHGSGEPFDRLSMLGVGWHAVVTEDPGLLAGIRPP